MILIKLGRLFLEMTAHAFQTNLRPSQKKELVGMMRNLPPHPEVPEALEQLRQMDYQIYTFTNSPRNLLQDQMRNSNLGQFFDKC